MFVKNGGHEDLWNYRMDPDETPCEWRIVKEVQKEYGLEAKMKSVAGIMTTEIMNQSHDCTVMSICCWKDAL